jgi:hypothetical protein
MPLFRKRPVTIEAVQFTGLNYEEIERFVGGDIGTNNGKPYVATLEGPMQISIGDYVIKGVKGEFYPCKPDIFSQTYDAV